MSKSIISNTASLTIFGILGTIIIGIFFSYSSLPVWSINIVITVLFVMLFIQLWVVFWNSSIPERIKEINDRRRRNNLAKKFYKRFKQEKFVDSFRIIGSADYGSHSSEHTFLNVIATLTQTQQGFESLPEPPINWIREFFTYWLELQNLLDRKIDYEGFYFMLREFEYIVRAHNRICVSEPLRKITQIDTEIDEDLKKEWKIALSNYDYFEKTFNQFVSDVNDGFKDSILLGLPHGKEL